MIALDTNVLARYVVRDEPRQTAVATQLIETRCTAESPGLVGLVVLVELSWVLTQGYRYRRPQVAAVLRGILAADELRVERSDLAWQALNHFEEGKADLADYLIGLSHNAEKAETTFTFDQRAATSPLFSLLEV